MRELKPLAVTAGVPADFSEVARSAPPIRGLKRQNAISVHFEDSIGRAIRTPIRGLKLGLQRDRACTCLRMVRPSRPDNEQQVVNRHSTVTHYQRPTVTQLQEGGTGGEVSEILFFSAKSKRPPSLIYSMQIIPVCLSIVARRKGVSATRRGGLNWTPISLLVGHPCKLFHTTSSSPRAKTPIPLPPGISHCGMHRKSSLNGYLYSLPPPV